MKSKLVIAALGLCLGGCNSSSDPLSPSSAPLQHASLVRMTMTQAGPVYDRPLCPKGERGARCLARVRTDPQGQALAAPSLAASGLSASDLQRLYLSGVDLDKDPGVTIAIVDAYGYRRAEADLKVYRQQNGLPECTIANGCFRIVNQKGEDSPLPKEDSGWAGESALDLDMASAMCPNCKLILVQSDDNEENLYIAEAVGPRLGAQIVSNSFGGTEDGTEPMAETKYLDLPSKPTIFASTGDDGYNGDTGLYPSTSRFTIGVGGTTLYGSSETAWRMGGSSCSTSIDKRSFEPASKSCSKRVAADVSAVGDPNTGVAVYFNGMWTTVGGTSASAPILAGVFASTGHAGEQPAFVYKHPEAFKDVTSGSNGSCGNELCNAGTGWDGPTGLGTPIGSKLAAIPPEVSNPPSGDMGSPGDMADDMGGEPVDMAQPAPDMDEGTVDMGGQQVPDASVDDGPSKMPPPSQGGCSLTLSATAPAGAVWLLALLGLALIRRLRRD